MNILRRIEKSLDQRMRGIFGGSAAGPGEREAIELYRDALDQVAQRATVGKRGDRLFPFDLVSIELLATNPERKAMLEALFEPAQLVDDITATLIEERVTAPVNLTVAVHYRDDAAVDIRVVCEKSQQATSRLVRVPRQPMRLVTLTGTSSDPEFLINAGRVNVGRESEVVDSLGRAIRRNDLFFDEGSNAANASVSRSHAHLSYDDASGEWRIFDDGSSLGTIIFRDGTRIPVPSHGTRGVLLRADDEIYLGQIRLRFVTA